MTEHSMSGATGWLSRFWELMACNPVGICIVGGKMGLSFMTIFANSMGGFADNRSSLFASLRRGFST